MAKREMSSTLKNLKFMQRATKREEIALKVEEQVIPDGNFPSSNIPRKCVVIMEGDPHPGATRGRLSFLSFNPYVDKLNGEVADTHQRESSRTSDTQGGGIFNRENGSAHGGLESKSLKMDRNDNDANEDLKRKHAEIVSDVSYPNKSLKKDQGYQASTPCYRACKQQKHETLDWNALRPPKPQNRMDLSR